MEKDLDFELRGGRGVVLYKLCGGMDRQDFIPPPMLGGKVKFLSRH